MSLPPYGLRLSVAGAVLNTLFQLGIAMGLAITTVLQGECQVLGPRRALKAIVSKLARALDSILPWIGGGPRVEGLSLLFPLCHGSRVGRGDFGTCAFQRPYESSGRSRDRGEASRNSGSCLMPSACR
jgi:hypothetical protein